jgi:hypothetical protein
MQCVWGEGVGARAGDTALGVAERFVQSKRDALDNVAQVFIVDTPNIYKPLVSFWIFVPINHGRPSDTFEGKCACAMDKGLGNQGPGLGALGHRWSVRLQTVIDCRRQIYN